MQYRTAAKAVSLSHSLKTLYVLNTYTEKLNSTNFSLFSFTLGCLRGWHIPWTEVTKKLSSSTHLWLSVSPFLFPNQYITRFFLVLLLNWNFQFLIEKWYFCKGSCTFHQRWWSQSHAYYHVGNAGFSHVFSKHWVLKASKSYHNNRGTLKFSVSYILKYSSRHGEKTHKNNL